MGERTAGADNDSYFDELFLSLNFLSEEDTCSYYSPQNSSIESYRYLDIDVYPNPFSHCTILRIPKSIKGNLTVDIYDIKGILVKQINNVAIPKIIINRGDLIDGLYLLQLKKGNKVLGNLKLVIES